MAVLTHHERVLMAVQHRQPDQVPYYFSFTGVAARKLEAFYSTSNLDLTLENDMVRYSPRSLMMREVRSGFFQDEFGVVWNRMVDKDIGIPEDYQLEHRSLEGYAFPNPYDPRRYQHLPDFIQTYPTCFRLLSFSLTLFERSWSLRSMPELMVDMLEAPEWVEELFDALMAYQMKVLEEFLKYDIHGVLFGDDWGQQRGMLFSPHAWRRFIKPRLAELIGAVKRAGKVAMIHSCGKVQELFPDFIEIGVDVFNPFQPDVMDVYQVKRQYGDRISFYGGMSIQGMLPRGTPGQIRDETRRLMDEIGRGGGFIIGPSHHMPGDIPVDNMVAFVEAVREG